MGLLNCVTCRYQKELYEGHGMLMFAHSEKIEEDILSGRIVNQKARISTIWRCSVGYYNT